MMKNKFLFLIVLGLAFLTSCSDDDKDSPKDFNGTYSTTSTDHVLDLKYSDIVLTGKNVEFNSADGVKATLRLKGVVYCCLTGMPWPRPVRCRMCSPARLSP